MIRALAPLALEQRTADVMALLEPAAELYYRLILVVGKARTGKTAVLQGVAAASGGTVVSLGLAMSSELLAFEPRQYPLKVPGLLDSLVKLPKDAPVILDNTDLLFDSIIAVDPLLQLQKAARSRIVVAAWRGHVERSALHYAQPGHRDARVYPLRDLLLVDLNPGIDA